jgi:uncharacterized protein with HEPN domain
MSFESRDYLRHILVEADYLFERSAGLSYDVFAADETLRRAFVRSLETSAKQRSMSQRTSGHSILRWSGEQWRVCEIA